MGRVLGEQSCSTGVLVRALPEFWEGMVFYKSFGASFTSGIRVWQMKIGPLRGPGQSTFIAKVTKPTAWCAPMVPVVKPKRREGDPAEVRITRYFRKLNKGLKRERYTMPVFEELTAQFAGNH